MLTICSPAPRGRPAPPRPGKNIMEHSMIVKHYLQTWFVIDFLAILPIDIAIRIRNNE